MDKLTAHKDEPFAESASLAEEHLSENIESPSTAQYVEGLPSSTEVVADCVAASGTPTDVLHAIAWTVTVRAGWADALHTQVLNDVLDVAGFLFDCIAHEHEQNTGIKLYPDNAGFDDMTAEHRPDFFRLVAAMSDQPPALEAGEHESVQAMLIEAYVDAMEHGTSLISALCIAAEEFASAEEGTGENPA
ncbi:hypothetical protein ACFV1N_25375 [Streptosporangium canum]|uniref:hypothetical protein n=1 Tax=Streptosporangium canum TaxID=324952 RepID=UPI0036C35E49